MLYTCTVEIDIADKIEMMTIVSNDQKQYILTDMVDFDIKKVMADVGNSTDIKI